MNQEEILDYNIRCAEFLEWNYNKFMDRWNEDMLHQYSFVESIELKFHSDWNWIMEVVEAIEKLKTDDFYMEWLCLNGSNVSLRQMCKRQTGVILWEHYGKYTSTISKKEAVVQAINQFLIWHEKQTTNEQQ